MALDSPEAIIEFADIRAKQSWEKFGKPMLLSLLGSELSALNREYGDLIEPLKLREFLTANSQDKFAIIQHPTQKPKVGLIPYGKEYVFPIEDHEEGSAPDQYQELGRTPNRRTQGKYVVQNFLDLLANLDHEDVQRVQIPIDVIAKMIRYK